MEQIERSETSAYIIQMPGNYPKENIIYSEHGESLKSRITVVSTMTVICDNMDISGETVIIKFASIPVNVLTLFLFRSTNQATQ